jgi:23S rRNA pseudouridine1911/1915/1917 synthase
MGDDLPRDARIRRDVAVATGPGRADAVFAVAFPEFSRARIQRLISDGHARVDGSVTKKAAHIEAGARLTVDLPVRARATAACDIDLPVLFEDASVVVIDKPAGLAVHGGPEDQSESVARWFEATYPSDAAEFDVERPGIVHRLDKGTSGVMVVARTPAAQAALSEAFAERRVKKQYLALVDGVPEQAHAVIDAPIGRHRGDRTRMAILDTGRESRTEYELLGSAHGRSLLHLKPVTGRTHQIRVHLASIGVPVADDAVYGKGGSGRHLLHAWRLELPHPDGGALIATAKLPRDMQESIRTAGLEPVALNFMESSANHTPEPGE